MPYPFSEKYKVYATAVELGWQNFYGMFLLSNKHLYTLT